ncbi:MAG TPA: hypothetical protein ENK32_03210 [Anaerolineae bacterium]|nr:hypothetical protein [Anaerolineae bacterium]
MSMTAVSPSIGVGVIVGVGVAVGDGVTVGVGVEVTGVGVNSSSGVSVVMAGSVGLGTLVLSAAEVAVSSVVSGVSSVCDPGGGPPNAPLDGVRVPSTCLVGTCVLLTSEVTGAIVPAGGWLASVMVVGVAAAVCSAGPSGTPARKNPSNKNRQANA